MLFMMVLTCQLNAQEYQPDLLGEGYESLTIHMPDDYDGKVVTTLIRKFNSVNRKAVLYIHGFSDYFFQKHLADQFLANGYDFYALDLRKYGRSHLSHQRLFNVRDIHEYDADIDTALSLMRSHGYDQILLNGHSTGGLIVCCYVHQHPNCGVAGLILNSPFLDMNLPAILEVAGVPVLSKKGKKHPEKVFNKGTSALYGMSIHKQYYGEWTFDTTWKPIASPPVNLGWARAIHLAHKEVQQGNIITIPILLVHSDHSVYGNNWSEKFRTGDAVLDVKDISKYGKKLGPHVTESTIKDGLHDLSLSRPAARRDYFNVLHQWLNSTSF